MKISIKNRKKYYKCGLFFILFYTEYIFAESWNSGYEICIGITHNEIFKNPQLRDDTIILSNKELGMYGFPGIGLFISTEKKVKIFDDKEFYFYFGLDYSFYRNKLERTEGTAQFLKRYFSDPPISYNRKETYLSVLSKIEYHFENLELGVGLDSYYLYWIKVTSQHLSGFSSVSGENAIRKFKIYPNYNLGIKLSEHYKLNLKYIPNLDNFKYFKIGIKYMF